MIKNKLNMKMLLRHLRGWFWIIIVFIILTLAVSFYSHYSTLEIVSIQVTLLTILISLFVYIREKEILYRKKIEFIEDEFQKNRDYIKKIMCPDLEGYDGDNIDIQYNYINQLVKLNNWYKYKHNLATYNDKKFENLKEKNDLLENLISEAKSLKKSEKTGTKHSKFRIVYKKNFKQALNEFITKYI